MDKFTKLMKVRCAKLSASYELFRFVFSGKEKVTGTQKLFSVELALVNSALSSDKVVLGYKTRAKPDADIQNVILGTKAASNLAQEKQVTPSYIAVRATIMGGDNRQVARYYTLRDTQINNKSFNVKVADCVYTEHHIAGHVKVTQEELDTHSEYFCDAGDISWDIEYKASLSFNKYYSGKLYNWAVPGARVDFNGRVFAGGLEYSINSDKIPGYIEHYWGRDLNPDWFHISATNLISVISGHLLHSSCLAVHGIFDNRVSLMLNLEGHEIIYTSNQSKRAYTCVSDVVESPDKAEKLHWSTSIHSSKYVIDIDLFCDTSQLCMRPWERASVPRQLLKVLSGATGLGEVRLYKRLRKDLVLIEQARITNGLCDYGKIDG